MFSSTSAWALEVGQKNVTSNWHKTIAGPMLINVSVEISSI